MPPAKVNRRPPTPGSRARKAVPPRRFPVIPVTIAIVLVLGVVAVLVSRGGDDDDAAVEETRPVAVQGDPVVALGDGEDPAVGTAAPQLDGAGFDGTPLRIGADGRPKVVVFLAHWCPHCQREVPVLSGWLADNGAPADVDLYGVSTGTSAERPNYPPSAWLEREDFTVPVLVDDASGTAAQAYGLSAYPFFVALDGDNRVLARTTGELTVEQWEDLVGRAAATAPAGAS